MVVTKIDIKTSKMVVKDGEERVHFAEFKNGASINLADLSDPLHPIEHEIKRYRIIRTMLNGKPHVNYLVPEEWIPALRMLFFNSFENEERMQKTIESTKTITTDKIKSLSWWRRLLNKF